MSFLFNKLATAGKCQRAGFTLIELLVVVLIIGVLAAVAVPQYQAAVDKTRFVQLITNTDAALKAEQAYFMANGAYAVSWEDLGGVIPAGYTLSSPRLLQSPDQKIGIHLGCATPAPEGGSQPADCPISYLYSKDNRVNAAYWTNMTGTDRRCLAYAAGEERAKKLCRSITGNKTQTQEGNGSVSYRF